MSPEEKEDMRARADDIAALLRGQSPPVAAGILAMLVLAAMIETRAKDREAAIAGFVSTVRAHLAKGDVS
jgi:hypothetical protein